LTAFTIQRFLIVKWPLASKFKKKSYAWRITFSIIIVSMAINIWALISFKLKQVNGVQLCDINTELIDLYHYISLFYIILSMLCPMVIMLVLNLFIINKTSKDDKNREQLRSGSAINNTLISSDYKTTRRNAIKNSKILKNRINPEKLLSLYFWHLFHMFC
jgi:hypothetical protein